MFDCFQSDDSDLSDDSDDETSGDEDEDEDKDEDEETPKKVLSYKNNFILNFFPTCLS